MVNNMRSGTSTTLLPWCKSELSRVITKLMVDVYEWMIQGHAIYTEIYIEIL